MEEQSELVMVPVPRGDLMAVYELLARLHREGGAERAAAGDDAPADAAEVTVPWTVEELRRFATTGSTTNATIGKVLDVLAGQPGTYFSTSELEELTGVPRSNLKGSMSALTRHINKHYPGHGWMFEFAWGTHLGPEYPSEAHYRVDEPAAALWREASG